MPIESAEDIHRVARAFQESRILLTAVELDIFSWLGDLAKPSEELALEIGADPRGLDRLMNALVAMGLLDKSGGLFTNMPAARRWLASDSPEFLGWLHHTLHLWENWSTLTESVLRGGRTLERPVTEDSKERWEESFIRAMHARAAGHADEMIGGLELDGVQRVLDVGGGSGVYAQAFARAGTDIHATVMDLPSVCGRALGYAEEAGLDQRIDTLPGDMLETTFPGGFDLVFISAIVHMLSPEENVQLIEKSAGALRPGGRVVVVDFLMDRDRTTPPEGALFAINMLVATDRGDTYTEEEIRDWMEAAGLRDVRRQKAPGRRSDLLVGFKTPPA